MHLCVVVFSYCLVVPKCGKLFEWYMDSASPYQSFRVWRKLVKESVSQPPSAISDADQDMLITHNSNSFIGWLLFHLSAISTQCRRQMFYHTFVLQYYGLSRNGIDLLSKYGYCQSIRSFDNSKEEAQLDNSEITRLMIDNIIVQFTSLFFILSLLHTIRLCVREYVLKLYV